MPGCQLLTSPTAALTGPPRAVQGLFGRPADHPQFIAQGFVLDPEPQGRQRALDLGRHAPAAHQERTDGLPGRRTDVEDGLEPAPVAVTWPLFHLMNHAPSYN